jgi:hypothetical protein
VQETGRNKLPVAYICGVQKNQALLLKCKLKPESKERRKNK